jgi:phage terminase small subunit
MGKARHPHNTKRPLPKNVKLALDDGNLETLKKALSFRQYRFAEEYVVDFNGTAAVLRAGYSANYPDRQASTLLRHEGVRAVIDHLSKSKEAKITAVDPEYLLQKLIEVMNKEGARDGDILRAVELYMKHKGMFIDRQEISGPDGEAIKVKQETEQNASDVISTLKRMGRPDLKVVNSD